jgi:hypothetical protein
VKLLRTIRLDASVAVDRPSEHLDLGGMAKGAQR